jgi:hypothetical protein
MEYSFDYTKLGDFTYHVLHDPVTIKSLIMKWIMHEWELDHNEAPAEHWTVAWMNSLPTMEFTLEIINLDDVNPHPDLMSVPEFISSLQKRAAEREKSVLRGTSLEPLLINRNGFQLMDGYTRYTVLKRQKQKEVYAYVGSA